MAGNGLTNTLALYHSKDPAEEFPLVMGMASGGWIASGLAVSWFKLELPVPLDSLTSTCSTTASLSLGLRSADPRVSIYRKVVTRATRDLSSCARTKEGLLIYNGNRGCDH